MTKSALLSCALIIIILPSTAWCEDSSIFFNAKEIDRIEHAFVSTPPDIEAHNKKSIKLESILYFSSDNWTVWLQGRKWTPESQDKTISLIEVTPEWIKARVALADQKSIRIVKLRPNQILNLVTGSISKR
jgi:hypothetical protein